MVPYFDKSYDNKMERDDIPKWYITIENILILTAKEYKEDIQNENNWRGMYGISGIEILKDSTIWNNNKYYFVQWRVFDMVIENWKKIIPTLECKLVKKWYYQDSWRYIDDLWDCGTELTKVFPEGHITFFDV